MTAIPEGNRTQLDIPTYPKGSSASAREWHFRIEAAATKGKTHGCCVLDCINQTLLGFVACRDHWLTLPSTTRAVLAQAFRRHQTDPEIFAEAIALARRLLNETAA